MGLEAFSSGYYFDDPTQSFLSAEHERVAQAVQEYNRELRLHFIPRDQRVTAEDHEMPYAVFHYPFGEQPYPVMLLREEDVNLTLIDKLYAADTSKRNVLSDLEKREQLAKDAQKAREAEERAEMHDMAKSIFRTPLHSYQISKDKKVNL